MARNETVLHEWFHLGRHIAIEDMHHPLCHLHFLRATEVRTFLCAHILTSRIDAMIKTRGVRHLLPHFPSQALFLLWASVCVTNRVAVCGFLCKNLLFFHIRLQRYEKESTLPNIEAENAKDWPIPLLNREIMRLVIKRNVSRQ